jgi:hypothetical protein
MATAYNQENNKVYGLIYDIDLSIEINDITSLIQECFDQVQIYEGLNRNEAFFISSDSGIY